MRQGTVIKAYSSFYYVEIGDRLWECRLRGKFRLAKQNVLPGDRVMLKETGDLTGVIEEVLPRTSVLDRPQVANVDQVVIVFACAEPDPQTELLDRMLVSAEFAGLLPVICYTVLETSAVNGTGTDSLRRCLQGRTTVFAGPSGSGKSSLLNAVHPGLRLKTGKVSEKIGRGRHTTRFAELLKLGPDSLVVDSPGFSSLHLPDIDKQYLAGMFPEFTPYAGGCRFNGCLHRAEPECAVKKAVDEGEVSRERYSHYLVFLEELISRERRY
jgi:ribosome biogenesis GTPase